MKPTTTSGFIAAGMEFPELDIGAFERVVEENRTRVLRFLFVSVRDMDAAETLTQDCFWRAYRSRHAFRGDCSIQTWLIRIAINLSRDYLRNRRLQFWKRAQSVGREEIADWPDRSVSPESKAAIDEQVRQVWEATKTLSERQRTVFLLRFVEDLDIREIALSMGLSESTVNVHLVRALRGIRKQLGETR